jgi:hypothetical protein
VYVVTSVIPSLTEPDVSRRTKGYKEIDRPTKMLSLRVIKHHALNVYGGVDRKWTVTNVSNGAAASIIRIEGFLLLIHLRRSLQNLEFRNNWHSKK